MCSCVARGYIYYSIRWISCTLLKYHQAKLFLPSLYSGGLKIWIESSLHLLVIIRKEVCFGWFFSLSLERIDFVRFLLSCTFHFLFFFFFKFSTTIHSCSLRVLHLGLWGFLVDLWEFFHSQNKKPFSWLLKVSSCLCIPISTKLHCEKIYLPVSVFIARPQKSFITWI